MINVCCCIGGAITTLVEAMRQQEQSADCSSGTGRESVFDCVCPWVVVPPCFSQQDMVAASPGQQEQLPAPFDMRQTPWLSLPAGGKKGDAHAAPTIAAATIKDTILSNVCVMNPSELYASSTDYSTDTFPTIQLDVTKTHRSHRGGLSAIRPSRRQSVPRC